MGLLRGRCSSKSGGHALNPSLRSTQDLAITPSESNTRAQDHYSYESVTVFSIDDHNGLCDIKCGAHVGLHGGGEYYASAGNIHREVVHKQYARFFAELTYFPCGILLFVKRTSLFLLAAGRQNASFFFNFFFTQLSCLLSLAYLVDLCGSEM